jgi:hypothetical protein
VLAVAGLGLVSLTGDAHHASQTTPAVASHDAMAPGEAGLRAFINPETGKVEVGTGAAFEFDADTENALRRDSEGLVEVRHADGSVSVDLQGRFQSVSMIHVDENGKKFVCTDHAQHASNVMAGQVADQHLEVK